MPTGIEHQWLVNWKWWS